MFDKGENLHPRSMHWRINWMLKKIGIGFSK
jgi:hypothetical protein